MPTKKQTSSRANFLFRYTIKQIHTAILQCGEDKKKLAYQLQIADFITLPTHLGKFIFNGLPLTLSQLAELSIVEASAQMGEYYDVILPTIQPQVSFYSIAYLHHVCSAVTCIRSAAILLGVRDHSLHRHLSQNIYDNSGMNVQFEFDTFRSSSYEDIASNYHSIQQKLYHHLPFERFNLTPEIAENWAALTNIENPICLYNERALKTACIENTKSENNLSTYAPVIEEPVDTRKRQYSNTLDTAGIGSNVGQLSGLSMFDQRSGRLGIRPGDRIRKKRRDPDYFYPELSSDVDSITSTSAEKIIPASAETTIPASAGSEFDLLEPDDVSIFNFNDELALFDVSWV